MFARSINDKKLLDSLVTNKGYSVIDTRSPVEYRDGTLHEAPNAPLRNFMGVFVPTCKNAKGVVLIGSRADEAAFKACIRYAEQSVGDKVKLSYYYY